VSRASAPVVSGPALLSSVAALSGFVGVAVGAFSAHALKARIAHDLLAAVQTGVQYQFWHTLAVLSIAIFWQQRPHSRLLGWSGAAMLAGIVLFSGSLYALGLTGQRGFGIITPFGGLSLLAGWLLLALDRILLFRNRD